MTLEYVLLLVVVFAISLKFFVSAPLGAFKESGPRLAARVEKHLETGAQFTPNKDGKKMRWKTDK